MFLTLFRKETQEQLLQRFSPHALLPPATYLGRGCSGMGCASTRMILPPAVLTAERSRVACLKMCMCDARMCEMQCSVCV
jgi:hypothetical protein